MNINRFFLNLMTLGASISAGNNWTLQNGTIDAGTSSVSFFCPADIDMQSATVQSFYNISIGDTNTRRLTADVNVSNVLDIANGNINLNSKKLTIANSNPAAITRNTGIIQSETDGAAGYGIVGWNIGNASSGNYSIPFGTITPNSYIPLNIEITAAGTQLGTGQINAATYSTLSAAIPNNRPLPIGVNNMNSLAGTENAAIVVDRFWPLSVSGYSSNPNTSITFSYNDNDFKLASNAITESKLKAHRWLGSNWEFPALGNVDTIANQVTRNSINQYSVFTLLEETSNVQLVANAGNDTTVCAGALITLGGNPTASGGTPPYQYLWSTGQNSSSTTISSLTSVIITLTVTDNFGATASDTVIVTVNPNPVIDTMVVTDATCYNGGNGVIDLTLNSGSSFIISLFNGNSTISTNDPVTGLSANTYQVRAIDSNNCTSSVETVIITEPDPINIQITSTSAGNYPDTLCVSVTGGTAAYSYNFSGNANLLSNSCFELLSGTFEVTVTDANACTATSSNLCSGFQVSGVVEDVSCNGINGGNIELIISGGSANYTYAWNNNSTTEDLFNLFVGNYFVTITDANNCTIVKSFTVNEPLPINLSATVTNISCNGSNDGAIDLTLNSPFYIYSWTRSPFNWNSFSTTEDITNLASGWYYVEVLDTNQCYSQDSFLVTEPSPIIISSTVTNVSCFGGNDGSIDLTVSGGTPNFVYIWSPGAVLTQDISGLLAGTYTVTVSDQNGCTADTVASITQPDELTAQINAINGSLPETLTLTGSGGTPPYNYLWFTNQTSQSITTICPWNVVGWITDANNCVTSDTIDIQDTCINNCVWPGDADNNGIADNNDLLPIGLAYGTNGFSRCNTAIDWKAVYADDWTDTLASGTNYKHIDCDGDGNINADDTLAIIQNFGFTHAKNNQSQAWRMNAPALLVDLTPQTVIAGQILTANLILGDINIPATDVYGLAFTLNYDALVVDSTQTSIVFDNSWLGNATDKISIAKDLPQQGQIKCAITRIDKNTRSGSGIIGKASFIITTDNINGKNQLAYYNMNVWISDLTVIDNNGQVLIVNEGSDSTQVEYEPLAINEALINEMKIYPNPAQNEVLITVSDKLLSGTLTLVDTEGKILFSKTIDTLHNNILIATFANGVYYVKIVTETGVVTKRLAIVK